MGQRHAQIFLAKGQQQRRLDQRGLLHWRVGHQHGFVDLRAAHHVFEAVAAAAIGDVVAHPPAALDAEEVHLSRTPQWLFGDFERTDDCRLIVLIARRPRDEALRASQGTTASRAR